MAEKFHLVLLPSEVSKRKVVDALKTFDVVSVIFVNYRKESILATFTKVKGGYREVIQELTSDKVIFDYMHGDDPYFIVTTIQVAVGQFGTLFQEVKSRIRRFINDESVMKD